LPSLHEALGPIPGTVKRKKERKKERKKNQTIAKVNPVRRQQRTNTFLVEGVGGWGSNISKRWNM
jgi:dethiobiotin synthetase